MFLLFTKNFALVKLGIFRFTLRYDKLNDRTLIGKENYTQDLSDDHGTFCYARSRSIVVFR
jgi:hypothetical protein